MELAKVMAKGQVTISISVRKKLTLKEGDKVVFIEKDDVMIIVNSAMLGLVMKQTVQYCEGFSFITKAWK